MTLPATTPAVLRLTLPGWDMAEDSPNKVLGKHWRVRAGRARAAKEHVFVALHTTPHPIRAFRAPVHLEFVRLRGKGQRALDPDNLDGACKPLIDALVAYGVLVGDTSEHVACITRREEKSADGKPAVRIEVRAAGA